MSQEVVISKNPLRERTEIGCLYLGGEITTEEYDRRMAALDAQVAAAGGMGSYAREVQEARFEYRKKHGVWPED